MIAWRDGGMEGRRDGMVSDVVARGSGKAVVVRVSGERIGQRRAVRPSAPSYCSLARHDTTRYWTVHARQVDGDFMGCGSLICYLLRTCRWLHAMASKPMHGVCNRTLANGPT